MTSLFEKLDKYHKKISENKQEIKTRNYNFKYQNFQENDWMEGLFGLTDNSENDNNIFKSCENISDKAKKLKELYQSDISYSEENGILKVFDREFFCGWFIEPTLQEIFDCLEQISGLRNKKNQNKKKIKIVVGKDANSNILEKPQASVFQVASQLNALEMLNQNKTPFDGIYDYIYDKTQGPISALSCAPGLFYRNYLYMNENMSQFNSLEKIHLSHTNGYLVWGNKPESCSMILDFSHLIKIPCMLFTEVSGAKNVEKGRWISYTSDKKIHQVFSSSFPINTYNNGGKTEIQLVLVSEMLIVQYMGIIGMNILLSHFHNKYFSESEIYPPSCELTLVGAGVFNNPLETVVNSLKVAIKNFEEYDFNLTLNIYQSHEAKMVEKYLFN